jgi:hypothetical protein
MNNAYISADLLVVILIRLFMLGAHINLEIRIALMKSLNLSID